MGGHQARGDLRITCQANGRWSRPEGACHRISCGRPSVEAGVSLLSSTFVYGSKVPFTCPSGETHRRIKNSSVCNFQGNILSTLRCIAVLTASGLEDRLDALPYYEDDPCIRPKRRSFIPPTCSVIYKQHEEQIKCSKIRRVKTTFNPKAKS